VIKRLFVGCLAALALSAGAVPVTFFDVQYEATAIATGDGLPGYDTQSSLSWGASVTVSADSIGATDVATAGAFGGPGLLTTSADVSGGGGIASAVATSRFTGSFLNAGKQTVSLDFTPVDFTVGSGSASTSLFVSLTSGGVTLFQDYVTGPWEFAYDLTPGSTSLLDLTLASEVSAGFPTAGLGNASGVGLVSFTVSAVPLPATWLLFLTGLGPLGFVVRRRRAPQAAAEVA
jgi:hypothetical protein